MKQLLKYFKEVMQELKKVSWPTKNQTYQMTTLVLIVTIATALYIGGLDFLFQQLMKIIIG